MKGLILSYFDNLLKLYNNFLNINNIENKQNYFYFYNNCMMKTTQTTTQIIIIYY